MSTPGLSAVDSSADALRIVLLGLPGAGKTSLATALSRCAGPKANLLEGPSSGSGAGPRAGDAGALPTTAPTATARVDSPGIESSRAKDPLSSPAGRALVIDSDGIATSELLSGNASASKTRLSDAVLRADALVILVDCTGTLPQVDSEFAEFERFLNLLEEVRGDRIDAGGLPVFPVLAKCDLLARPGDSTAAWIERIEERKRDIQSLFRSFSARAKNGARPSFGHLEIHLWATAIKRPTLTGSPAVETEPFGVAELLGQCLEYATMYRQHRRESTRRLRRVAILVSCVVAVLSALTIFVAAGNGANSGNPLESRIEEMRFYDSPSAADRLRGSPYALERRLAEFDSLRQEPAFPSVSSTNRNYVRLRIDELREYIAYFEKVLQVPEPADAAGDDRLKEIAAAYDSLVPPRADWSDTDACQLRADRLNQAEELAKAVARARTWYELAHDRARDLRFFAGFQPTPEAPAIDWRRWYDAVSAILDPAYRPPFEPDETIADTALTYATALHFERVVEARAEWETEKDRLLRVVDVSAALGLLSDVQGHPALLVIPRPPDFPLNRSRERLIELQKAYPRYRTEFIATGLPDAMMAAVRQAARANLEYLLAPGRAAVALQLRLFSGEHESSAGWAKTAAWLAGNPPELAAWRELALLLERLQNATAADPVSTLISFLQKKSFPIEFREVTLEVPFRYSEIKPGPGADLEIFAGATTAENPIVACAPMDSGSRDETRRVTLYTFRPRRQNQWIYHPGDDLRASLKLRNDMELVWSGGRSEVYSFERLRAPARLRRGNEANSERVDGVVLHIEPADGLPKLPGLLPISPFLQRESDR